MKTLRLTKSESAAYANGERRFWRAMRKQPDRAGELFPHLPYWRIGGYRTLVTANNPYHCPYGTPSDRITLAHGLSRATLPITAITIEQRDGKWGWVVEVGA